MSIRAILLAAAAASMTSAPLADDAIPGRPGIVESTDPFIYFQFLGGGVAAGEITQVNPVALTYDLSADRALIGTVGVVLLDGISVEADMLHARRSYTDIPGDSYSTTSLMANIKYTAALTDRFGVYGAVGAGAIWGQDYFNVFDANYYFFGGGYQLMAGAEVNLTPNLAAIAEVRYQNSFAPLYDAPKEETRRTAIMAVTAGIKVGF